jgi:hypothetical protein
MDDGRPSLEPAGIDAVESIERDARHRLKPAKVAIGALLTLLLLVNLATSVYQLPLNRVIERRLCHEFYTEHDPSQIGHDGSIGEEQCKIDQVQKGLAWIQGAMDTAWIVGGEFDQLSRAIGGFCQHLTAYRLCHDYTTWLYGREIWPARHIVAKSCP